MDGWMDGGIEGGREGGREGGKEGSDERTNGRTNECMTIYKRVGDNNLVSAPAHYGDITKLH